MSCQPDEIEPYPDCVKEYADILKQCHYKKLNIVGSDWPPKVGNDDVFGRIALIQQKDNSSSQENNSFPQKYTSTQQKESSDWHLLRGQVDEICHLAGNEKVEIKDILKPTINDCTSLIVLIDGPPGIGKTTLCRKLLHMWSDGELVPHYDLVLYCPLRNEKIAKADTLKDLFVYKRNNVPMIVDLFEEYNGEGMLIIFDGWDELSEHHRQSSLAADIIRREQLDQCSVIVTSRSYASSSLIKTSSLNKHVQVIGFSKDEIAKVIIQTLQKDKILAQELLEENSEISWNYFFKKTAFFKTTQSNEESQLAVKLINDLKKRSDVQSLCFIPFICSIVISIYSKEKELKTTLTELYENFIVQTIKRQIEKQGCPSYVFNSLSSLPVELAEPFEEICQFAYTNLANNNKDPVLTFVSHQIIGMSAAKDNYFGLLTTFIDHEENYQFIHLSIQEFLAACWIAKRPNPEQIFKTHFDNDHFRMCLRFVAGLTRLSHKSYEQYFNIPIDLQCKKKRIFGFEARYQSYFYTNPIVDHVDLDNFLTHVDHFPILLLHLLYESQNKDLCQALVLSISPQSICFHALQFSLFDILCLNYFLNVNSTTHWNHLHLMPLYQDELSVLTTILNTKRLDAYFYGFTDDTILQLRNIQECYINISGTSLYACDVLVKFLSFSQIKILRLKVNENIKKYNMKHCCCSDLEKCLAKKTTLQEFNVQYTQTNLSLYTIQEMYDIYYNHERNIFNTIIEGICKNTSITFLSLHFSDNACLTGELMKQLFNENKTLKALSGTFLFSPEDMVETISTSLVAMDINLPLGLINGLECILLSKLHPSHVVNPSLVVTRLELNSPESAVELFDILKTDNKLKALKLKIIMSVQKFSCDICTFKNMCTSMKEMLQQNQMLECLEIKSTFDIKESFFDIPVSNTRTLPHTFLSYLITGLEGNNTLQQLRLPIPLTTNCMYNKENDVKALFSLLSCRKKLTELQLDFQGHDQEQTIIEIDNFTIFQDHVLPMITNMLLSNKWIEVLSLNVHFSGSPRRKNTWEEFFDAILNHPSLQHVGLKLSFESTELKDFLKGQIEVKELKEAPVIICA
ncbi:PREDICTED: uncharacterized protein LOC109586951 [Amphimedon queenslandica]|uniref:NACHT domain-containing protein n=1 Tax=Amphimedon queenslandica TaxID=400682 RepID=A0AAN0JNX4_AMPQE|nr:PREDICTED: uncharacterized protein LOC109586951 [Amphimedon queenslandica]|eukprot:XP_019858719.1 PREDICTED: uncharacterized protein LOC109586951 [Amphimedon queenslandica]